MADWRRKHVSALADGCRSLSGDPSLSLEHQYQFVEAYAFAKQFTSIPGAGEGKDVMAVIAMVCNTCRLVLNQERTGRCHWQQRCLLSEGAACQR